MEHTLEAFDLYYNQGYTEHQIGEHFHLNEDALKKLMARVRALAFRRLPRVRPARQGDDEGRGAP